MPRRYYGNLALPTTLTAAVDAAATSLPVVSTANYPNVPFMVGIERATANEEACLCTALTATTLTVTRGYDGTTAKAHANNVKVEHCVGALDFDEANVHINDAARDDHPQYLNAARLQTSRTEVWTDTVLPLSNNYEGRVVFATALTNTYFRNLFYEYRDGAWGLLETMRWQSEHVSASDFSGAAGYWDLVVIDLGAPPCAVTIMAHSFLLGRTNGSTGYIQNFIRNAANTQLAAATWRNISAWHQHTHIFVRLPFASGASTYLKNTVWSDVNFILTRSDATIAPRLLLEVF